MAIVLNNEPFLASSDALKAYTSPVAYLDATEFDQEFSMLVTNIADNFEFLKTFGENAVLSSVFEAFRAAVLCTKHPGFREEREWRVIYTPSYNKSNRLIHDIQIIGGVPQPICKIPLVDIPEEGLKGIEIPDMIDRVIVGPTQFPTAIREAFITLLSRAGMTDASNRVFVSDIPLRT